MSVLAAAAWAVVFAVAEAAWPFVSAVPAWLQGTWRSAPVVALAGLHLLRWHRLRQQTAAGLLGHGGIPPEGALTTRGTWALAAAADAVALAFDLQAPDMLVASSLFTTLSVLGYTVVIVERSSTPDIGLLGPPAAVATAAYLAMGDDTGFYEFPFAGWLCLWRSPLGAPPRCTANLRCPTSVWTRPNSGCSPWVPCCW